MQHIHMERCQSTQIEIQKLLDEKSDNYLVSSEFQSLGKGQREKKWFSVSNALAMSFNLKSSNTISLTSLEMGVLISKFFESEYQVEIELKWPNDLYIDRKKCGGILIQKNHHMICGIGLNLFHAKEYPSDIPRVTSIFNKPYNVSEVAKKLYLFISDNRMHDEKIRTEFMQRCVHQNELVTIIEDGKEITGTFLDVGSYGEARVLINDEVKSIYSASLLIK